MRCFLVRRVWVRAVALVLLAAGLLVPNQSATAMVSPPRGPGAETAAGSGGAGVAERRVVALVTGDRVAVTSWSDGREVVRLLPGSPHAGQPFQTVSLRGHPYLLPAGVGRRYDPSVFDLDRLARLQRGGAVPLMVTFRPGVGVRDLPGLAVDADSAHRTAVGTVAAGRYRPSEVAQFAASDPWDMVASVSLPGAGRADPAQQARAARRDGYELHTLTVKVTTVSGGPVGYTEVGILNVDDARLFYDAFVPVVHGEARLSVPTGTYGLVTSVGNHIVQEAELDVSAEQTVTLSAADATSPIRISTPGADVLGTSFHLDREAAGGGSIEWGFGGFPNGSQKVEPAPPVEVGRLTSSVGGDLMLARPGPDSPVFATSSAQGVPTDLTRRYERGDFTPARATYAAGQPVGGADLSTPRFFPGQNVAGAIPYPLRRPLARTELFSHDDPTITWFQNLSVASFGAGEFLSHQFKVEPGVAMRHHWLGGPVVPGPFQRSRDRASSGPNCAACRDRNSMRLQFTSWKDTGGNFGFVFAPSTRTWRLETGSRVLARGDGPYLLAPDVKVPAGDKPYRLVYNAVRPDKAWNHSTATRTEWEFRSSHTETDRPLPVLFPRYRMPLDLLQRVDAGPMRFRLKMRHLRGTPPVRAASARVRMGGNGQWTDARVHRVRPDVFAARVDVPRPRGDRKWVTLQVTGKDRAGNRVTQTVKRAFQVRQPARSAQGTRNFVPAADRFGGARPAPACDRPQGHAVRCFAMVAAGGGEALDARLEPAGYGPQDLWDAYGIRPTAGARQTVAVVVAHGYPTAQRDLNRYRRQFGLARCSNDNGCFTKLNWNGQEGDYPAPDRGWALEAALDLAMVSTGCPRCDIVLVEARSANIDHIAKAARTAATVAPVVSHSYGLDEFTRVRELADAYDQPGVTNVASTGNSGYERAHFPASVPTVLATGGTALHRDYGPRGWRERAWSDASSGCSAYFAKPAWQDDPACPMRTIADVSAVASPDTGVAVYDSFGYAGQRGWFTLGGTSTAAPLVAGMLASTGAGASFTAAQLYADPARLHDITRGRNGFCLDSYICVAQDGYDGPTGLGTPRSAATFREPASSRPIG